MTISHSLCSVALLKCSVFIALVLGCSTLLHSSAYALSPSIIRQCKPIEAIYARGSGQGLGEPAEYKTYSELLYQYTKNTGLTVNIYELGTEHQRGNDGIGYKYPAVPVSDSLEGYMNAIGSDASRGYGNAYGKSVEDGVKELALYLNQRFGADGEGGGCRNSKIIIAGYSQGAQVVGQLFALNPYWVSQDIRDRIVYLALFGDPKLYLPEAESSLFNGFSPLSCKEQPVHSPWRKNVPQCRVYSGTLGLRQPYESSEFEFKTGLWCNAHDAVCDIDKLITDTAGHGEYVSQGRIEEGVKESLTQVAYKLERPLQKKLLYSVRNNGTADPSAVDLDNAALPRSQKYPLDIEGAPAFESPKPCIGYVVADRYKLYGPTPEYGVVYTQPMDLRFDIRVVVEDIYKMGCDVEILRYDSRDQYSTYATVLHATRDLDRIRATIDSLPRVFMETREYTDFSYSSCLPIINSYMSIDMHILENYIPSYGSDTYAARYYMRDTPYACNLYWAYFNTYYLYRLLGDKHVQWAPRSQLDHKLVFPSPLSHATSFGVRAATTQDAASPATATQLLPGDFSVKFLNSTYYAKPGNAIRFTIEPTNPAVSVNEYASYGWDFDNNGTIDKVTDQPTVDYAYSSPYNGSVRVVATNLENRSFEATTNVEVSETVFDQFKQDRLSRPAAPQNLSIQKGKGTSISISWDAADALAASWYIQVNDEPGHNVHLDTTHNVVLNDVSTASDISVSVAGITSQGARGTAAKVTLATTTSSSPTANTSNNNVAPLQNSNNSSPTAQSNTSNTTAAGDTKSIAGSHDVKNNTPHTSPANSNNAPFLIGLSGLIVALVAAATVLLRSRLRRH